MLPGFAKREHSSLDGAAVRTGAVDIRAAFGRLPCRAVWRDGAAAVGAEEGVTAHGGRVGMAQAQTMAGDSANAPAIRQQGGGKLSARVAHYTRKLSAKEGDRFP